MYCMGFDLEQRFASIIHKGDLLRPITPDMDPSEAIARLQEFNRRDVTSDMVRHRLDHLRQAGVADPETWTFYSNSPISEKKETTIDDLRENWSPEIE